MNITDASAPIKRGDVVATFHPEDLGHTDILHLDADHGTLVADSLLLSEEGVDSALASHAYLKDLSFINSAGQLGASQTLALKRIVLKYHRLWDPSPKPVSPDVPACDIRLREGAEFDHQGAVIPMNPPTRDKLRELIRHKLKRDIIEPSKSPNSSTMLLVPKPTGGVRIVLTKPSPPTHTRFQPSMRASHLSTVTASSRPLT
jgi:hypothetical protein